MPACTLSKQTCVKYVKAKRQVLLLCKRVAPVSRNLCFTAEFPGKTRVTAQISRVAALRLVSCAGKN